MGEKENIQGIREELIEEYGSLFDKEVITDNETLSMEFFVESETEETSLLDPRYILAPSGAVAIMSLEKSNPWDITKDKDMKEDILLMLELCILKNETKFPLKAYSVDNIRLENLHFFVQVLPYSNPYSLELLKRTLYRRLHPSF